MRLFTKDIDKKLFAQYSLGADLEKQMVVAKIFNPYGRGCWYLLNSDEKDSDYLWAIVDLFEVETGSVSRSELESVKVPPFGLGLERDLYFTPVNAKVLYNQLLNGKRYAKGGSTQEGIDLFEEPENIPAQVQNILDKYEDAFLDEDYKGLESAKKDLEKIGYTFEYYLDGQAFDLRPIGAKGKSEEYDEDEDELTGEREGERRVGMDEYAEGGEMDNGNLEMLRSNNKAIRHHTEELENELKGKPNIEAWVVAKGERAATDLSDITHYLDGKSKKMADGGELDWGADLGNGITIGTDIYITDPKSMYKGRTGFITGVVGKDYMVTISIDGNDRNVLVSKKGFDRLDAPEYAKGGETEELYKVVGKKNGQLVDISELPMTKEDSYKFIKKQGIEKYYTDVDVIRYRGVKPAHKMVKGGETTFKDKVKAVKTTLLKNKKVSPKVQKDYGKTYSPKEALESAKRIVGSRMAKYKK